MKYAIECYFTPGNEVMCSDCSRTNLHYAKKHFIDNSTRCCECGARAQSYQTATPGKYNTHWQNITAIEAMSEAVDEGNDR